MKQERFATPDHRPPDAGSAPEPRNDPRPAALHRHRLMVGSAIAIDLLALLLAFAGAALVRYPPNRLLEAASAPSGIGITVLGALLWTAFLSASAAYAPRAMISVAGQILLIAGAALPAWVLTHLLAFSLKMEIPFESRLAVALSLPAALIFLIAGRMAIVRPLARRIYRRLAYGPILVLGDTERAARLAADLERDTRRCASVQLRRLQETPPDVARSLVAAEEFSEVIIEPDGRALEDVFDTAFACLDARADVLVVSNQFHVVSGRASIVDIEGIPAMRFRRADLAGPESAVKRLVDVFGSAAALALLAPLLAAIAIAVKVSSPGPILYRQERVGRFGRRFTMLKFRTMVAGNDPSAHREYLKSFIREGAAASVSEDGAKIYKITRDPRVTAIGAWLRALSLDELPQLWNVVLGEMSLVGPRPCLPYEWDLYRPWQCRRLDVPPGCTGLWQVTARSHVTFEEMVILDLHYAHHGTVGKDLRLIAQTIPAMLRGRGGY